VDRGRGGDRMYYVCGKWDYIAKNCWERHKGRVVKTLQKLAKDNVLQTSFDHISTNSSTILMVSMAMESP